MGKPIDRSKLRSRVWEVILYPDATNYNYNLELANLVVRSPTYLYVTHDRDRDDDGNIKKAHTHFYIRYDNARYLNGVVSQFGIPENYYTAWDKMEHAAKYAMHANDEHKEFYSVDEVHTNIEDLEVLLSETKVTYDDQAGKLLDYIYRNPDIKTIDLMRYAVDNHCVAFLVKASGLWGRIIDKK